MYLKQLAFYTLQLKYLKVKNNATEEIILNTLSGLMSNLESGNKQFYQTLINLKAIIIESIATYKRICAERNIKPKELKTNIKLSKKLNITDIIQLGEKEFTKKLKSLTDEKRNLYELIFLVLKSICINLVELKSFETDYPCAYSEILYLLNTINFPELSQRILIKKINRAVKTDYILNQKLHALRREKYGEPTEAEVSYSTVPNKAILVAGTNLEELKKILDETKDKNIDIYTHGDMISAYMYPVFRTYPNLKGQFGKGIESCLLDFATFPGAIFIAKHALENIEYLYRGRLFTTDNFVPQGVIRIKNDDYSALINSALSARGFKTGKQKESVIIGCKETDIHKKLDTFIRNISNYRKLFIFGTDAHNEEQTNYYKSILKYTDDNTAIISLSDNIKNDKIINIRTGYDIFIIYKIWEYIVRNIKDNKISSTIFISKCDKHTISNIINLKLLGADNIFISKCSPVMLNPTLTKTLKSVYGINPTKTAQEDISKIV